MRKVVKTYTSARDAHEADAHQDTGDGDLVVAELDALKVLHAQSPGRDEAVEGENLVHLDGSDESAAALTDDVDDGDDVGQLRGEGGGDRGVSELDLRNLLILLHAAELIHDGRGIEL